MSYAHGAVFRPIVVQTGSGIQAVPIDSPILSSGEYWEGSQLLEVDLKPGYCPYQVALQDHIVALVADCSMDTTINDGRNRFTVHSGDIFLRSQQGLCQPNWSGCLRLYLLVIDHWHMLRITNGVLASSDCLFAPTFGLRDGEIAQAPCDLRNRLKMRGCVEKSYGERYTNQIAWQALRRSGRLPLHARDYKDPLSVSALKSVLDFVYAHVGEPSLRCAVLADVAGLPVDVFRDRFKRSIQRSVYQFVLDVRMECAVDQLLSTSKPIGQIAMDTGFADHSHFGKTFRSRLGQSPGDFRLDRNSARTPPGYLEPIPQCKASITTGFPERYSVST